MLLRVWEREKVVPDPYIAMKIGKTTEIFEERVWGKSLPVGARREPNRQQQVGTARKRLKGEPGRARQEQADRKRPGTDNNRLKGEPGRTKQEQTGEQKEAGTDNRLEN